jgi:hypothetical protein
LTGGMGQTEIILSRKPTLRPLASLTPLRGDDVGHVRCSALTKMVLELKCGLR